MYDVLIIGAGITGTLIARELSRYQIKVLVLEKDNDVGNRTTNANSAIIHSGYDPLPGTLKAKFNVLANPMFDQLTEELDVPFMRIGSLTVATYDEQLPILKQLEERSKINGVEVKLLSASEVKAMEPNISPDVKGALLAPAAGIIDPFNFCVHAMENAVDNGVTCLLNQEVISIEKQLDKYIVKTNKDTFETKIVSNAAGNYADKIASMVETIDWKITPRKGEYFLLAHFAYGFVNHVIFPLPSEKGKGVLVAPTTSSNYIVGPSSEEIPDKEDWATDTETLTNVKNQAINMVPNIPFNQVIRVFSGLRPTCSRHDFIVEYSKNDKCFINVAGIESPGLVSSPAIAKYVVEELIKPIIDLKINISFNPFVKKYKRMFYLSEEEKLKAIKENPEYGEMVCNCENISLGEINDALSRSVPPRSVKGLKRRTRAGFGGCQGGFCQPKVVMLLAKHYGVSPLEIPLDNEGSNILTSEIKGGHK